MTDRRFRPFSILDAMTLVAATAFGIVLGRAVVGDAFLVRHSPMWASRPVTFFLLPWTLAIVPIGLRHPRVALPRLFQQPGMVACTAAAAVTAIDVAARLIPAILPGAPGSTDSFDQILARYWRGNSDHVGTAVAVAWLSLALGGRWRPEKNWIDRLGRAIGCLWLLTLLCDWRFGRWTFNLTYRIWMNLP